MKNLISILILLSLSLLGCTENGDLVSPNNLQNETTQIAPNWLKFPASNQNRLDKVISNSKYINGSWGGSLSLFSQYNSLTNNSVILAANIQFSAGAFTDTKYITMAIDDEACIIEFSPSSTFDIPAVLNVYIMGLDLTNVDVSAIDFVYDTDSGVIESVEYDNLIVDVAQGMVAVQNAKLNHFSRYGWVN